MLSVMVSETPGPFRLPGAHIRLRPPMTGAKSDIVIAENGPGCTAYRCFGVGEAGVPTSSAGVPSTARARTNGELCNMP
jgi:hypothetical protein